MEDRLPDEKALVFDRKNLRRLAIRLLIIGVLTWLAPAVMLFYVVCGLLDVVRNRPTDVFTVYQYFFGRGAGTWALSPLNLLLDILALPYWNKGIYRLADLPRGHRKELQSLLETMDEQNLEGQIQTRLRGDDREMIFFKWYGRNLRTSLEIPEFHREFSYIRTIGVSIFKHRKSTNLHFGPIRMTLRVLYNVNDVRSDDAYIEVSGTKSAWNRNKLFIFDDTLLHKSVNETDAPRYCAFIDILRPTLFPRLFSLFVAATGYLMLRSNHVFYRNWTFIE